jgi:biopolymer transport protein ExbB/TolQ
VSAAEIIAKLPKLKETERRAISRRILELASKQEEIKLADEMFLAACQEIDRVEAKDAKAKPTPR